MSSLANKTNAVGKSSAQPKLQLSFCAHQLFITEPLIKKKMQHAISYSEKWRNSGLPVSTQQVNMIFFCNITKYFVLIQLDDLFELRAQMVLFFTCGCVFCVLVF
jgi:hypothetical protein